jgi:acetyl esterase/lipase
LRKFNYGIRWLKAHCGEFGSSAEYVGAYGTSSGGHQILLAAMRPDDPRYRALPLLEAPELSQACVRRLRLGRALPARPL